MRKTEAKTNAGDKKIFWHKQSPVCSSRKAWGDISACAQCLLFASLD